ncbi:hypothetical protein [Nesterenkonia sp. Act20]|uniref:hypothetical protein n=1 Tax=Nesterenkonia sp. Act20 TaxID=1483432 RepID=UPI001C47138C|nr:hypothetical protein [Nesterenkonia sp. Act20]
MSAKNTAFRFLNSPWSQPLAGGALTLIPGAKYPAWLRQTMTWGSAAAVTALVAVPGVGSAALKQASGRETVETVALSPSGRLGYAAAAGVFTYGLWRFGWWADKASEDALRRMRVPYPRVVLGAAVGALYYVTDDRDQAEEDA